MAPCGPLRLTGCSGLDWRNRYLVLTPDGLTGTGVSISPITRIHESSYANGTWVLEDESTGNRTEPLDAQATGDDVKYAIQDALGYKISNVDVSEYNDYGSRRWAVTFADIPGESSPKKALTNDTGLFNNIPLIQAKKLHWWRPRRGGLTSKYKMAEVRSGATLGFFNGAGPSEPIWHNAEPAEVKEKLEKLDSISHVEVSKVDDLFGARNGAHTIS